MTGQNESYRGTRILVIVAALVVIAFGIHEAQSVLASILIAVFLAALLGPEMSPAQATPAPEKGTDPVT